MNTEPTTTDQSETSQGIINRPEPTPHLVPEFQESTDQETTNVDQSETSQSNFAMPVIMFTFEQVKKMIDHRVPKWACHLFLKLLGNMNSRTGSVYRFKVKDYAADIGCDPQQIYRAIHILRKAGLAYLTVRYGTVRGKILGILPCQWLAKYEHLTSKDSPDTQPEVYPWEPYNMPVGMIHRTGVETLIKGGTSGGWIRLVMAACLNINVQTGELKKELRPQQWGNLAGINRTWVVRGFDHLNEIGFSQVKIDYDVEGRFPFVSLANGVFQLAKLAQEDRRFQDIHKSKEVMLFEAFGIQADGWAKEMIERAWRGLGDVVDALREKSLKKTQKELGLSDKTLPSFERLNILNGKTLSMAEALPNFA